MISFNSKRNRCGFPDSETPKPKIQDAQIMIEKFGSRQVDDFKEKVESPTIATVVVVVVVRNNASKVNLIRRR